MATPTASSGGALTSLKMKMQSLRDEMDKTKDLYDAKCNELDLEKGLRAKAEEDLSTLTKKLRLIEEDYEHIQTQLQSTNEKILELSKTSDENERARKALESRQNMDDEKMLKLEQWLKESKASCEDAEKKYEDVSRKLTICETELDRAEERAIAAETRVKTLDTEVHLISTTLKSLEISESKASKKEDTYEGTIKELTSRLKEAEGKSAEMERNAGKLQREVDRLEEELLLSREENKKLREEFDAAFQEIQNI
ncbi:hypothetical protein HELRODRAFT_63446 [Helobdella robusta]|uniref:Tropomyosin n=1 Tax=Helobdella robusta TaxID=6412 RepID=T1FXF9_HELRO|nr:hypothetical protein HELRODRAFT_63446 [Helobdella robusta]ESO12771.1 hypothetical protein HELRODRAFT_63446 [Helobdella robusta]